MKPTMKSVITLRAAGLAAVLVLMMAQPVSAAVEPGVEYPAGTKIDTPGAGVSFIIPKGWSGMLPKGRTFFVLGSPAQKAYIYVLVDKMTMAEAQENMTTPVALGNGLRLQLASDIRQQGKVLAADYSVEGGEDPIAGYIETLVGEGGLGVGYLAVSSPDTISGVQHVVHQLIQGTTLDEL
ncbi:MAG: hypothetical protein M3329_06425 [Pseudomonadota bacterium]|nr:hypothetical protein [Pseudomonadota bacterium]